MDIKLKLNGGDIFYWKYYGYSELIDNLEVDENIIYVFEPFSVKDFENTYLNYIKYIKFKNIVNDIINYIKLWTRKELNDIYETINYNLNNRVFDWLVIKETEEEKEIKKIILLESLKCDELKYNKESIILIHLCDDNYQNKFRYACLNGYLNAAQWIYNLGKKEGNINVNYYYGSPFRLSLMVSEYSEKITHKKIYTGPILEIMCEINRLNIFKWLYNLEGVKIDFGELFRIGYKNNSRKTIKWLYDIFIKQ